MRAQLFTTKANVVFNHMKTSLYFILNFVIFSIIFCMSATFIYASEYDVSDVDIPPEVERQVRISPPGGAIGKVVIRFLIGTDGKADNFEIVESEPEGIFDECVLSSLKKWKFKPGKKDGEPVPTWITVPFTFE